MSALKNLAKLWENFGSPKMSITEGNIFVHERLRKINFKLSTVTPGDGNCFLWALQDQMSFDPLWKTYKSDPQTFRSSIVASVHNLIFKGKIVWECHYPDNPILNTLQKWCDRMTSDNPIEYVDALFIQLASELLNRKFVIMPVFPPNDGHDRIIIEPLEKTNTNYEPFYFLYYSDARFTNPHYQSILKNQNNTSTPINRVSSPPQYEISKIATKKRKNQVPNDKIFDSSFDDVTDDNANSSFDSNFIPSPSPAKNNPKTKSSKTHAKPKSSSDSLAAGTKKKATTKHAPKKTNLGVFTAEKILEKRQTKGKVEYLVKWQGFKDPKYNTWEPTKNILDSKLIEEFDEEQNSLNSDKKKEGKGHNSRVKKPEVKKSNLFLIGVNQTKKNVRSRRT